MEKMEDENRQPPAFSKTQNLLMTAKRSLDLAKLSIISKCSYMWKKYVTKQIKSLSTFGLYISETLTGEWQRKTNRNSI